MEDLGRWGHRVVCDRLRLWVRGLEYMGGGLLSKGLQEGRSAVFSFPQEFFPSPPSMSPQSPPSPPLPSPHTPPPHTPPPHSPPPHTPPHATNAEQVRNSCFLPTSLMGSVWGTCDGRSPYFSQTAQPTPMTSVETTAPAAHSLEYRMCTEGMLACTLFYLLLLLSGNNRWRDVEWCSLSLFRPASSGVLARAG